MPETSACADYTYEELIWWIHLLTKRAKHRSDTNSLIEAQNYFNILADRIVADYLYDGDCEEADLEMNGDFLEDFSFLEEFKRIEDDLACASVYPEATRTYKQFMSSAIYKLNIMQAKLTQLGEI